MRDEVVINKGNVMAYNKARIITNFCLKLNQSEGWLFDWCYAQNNMKVHFTIEHFISCYISAKVKL